MDPDQPRPKAPPSGLSGISFPERNGAWLLSGCAAASWALAAAESAHQSVAVAFVTAGSLLFPASAFYSRVRSVGKDGVSLQEAAQVAESTPLNEDDTPEEVKSRVVRSLTSASTAQAPTPTKVPVTLRATLMERDRVSANVTSYFVAWLQRQGYEVVEQQVRADPSRSDLLAKKEADLLSVEFRPAIENLRLSDAAAIASRTGRDLTHGGRRGVVFSAAVDLDQAALDLFRRAGTSVFTVDPNAGVVVEHAPARPGPPQAD